MTHLFTQMKACATHTTNWGMKQVSPDPKEQLPTMLHSEGVNTIQLITHNHPSQYKAWSVTNTQMHTDA